MLFQNIHSATNSLALKLIYILVQLRASVIYDMYLKDPYHLIKFKNKFYQIPTKS